MSKDKQPMSWAELYTSGLIQAGKCAISETNIESYTSFVMRVEQSKEDPAKTPSK